MAKHPKQDTLESIIETIDGIISIEIDANNGNQISERIGICAALLSTSAHSVAVAQEIYDERLGEVLATLPPMSATDKKLILAGRLSKESFWVKSAERQNAALVHALDGYRSMLSYLKEEMKMSNYAPQIQN